MEDGIPSVHTSVLVSGAFYVNAFLNNSPDIAHVTIVSDILRIVIRKHANEQQEANIEFPLRIAEPSTIERLLVVLSGVLEASQQAEIVL